jgi:hypothetical protein
MAPWQLSQNVKVISDKLISCQNTISKAKDVVFYMSLWLKAFTLFTIIKSRKRHKNKCTFPQQNDEKYY